VGGGGAAAAAARMAAALATGEMPAGETATPATSGAGRGGAAAAAAAATATGIEVAPAAAAATGVEVAPAAAGAIVVVAAAGFETAAAAVAVGTGCGAVAGGAAAALAAALAAAAATGDCAHGGASLAANVAGSPLLPIPLLPSGATAAAASEDCSSSSWGLPGPPLRCSGGAACTEKAQLQHARKSIATRSRGQRRRSTIVFFDNALRVPSRVSSNLVRFKLSSAVLNNCCIY